MSKTAKQAGTRPTHKVPPKKAREEAPPLLDLVGAGMTYPNGTAALRDVSLTLAPGEFVGVVGPSGCGKSTLLRLAARLARPTEGEVTVTTERIGFVFQDPTLLPWRTLRRNVELAAELRGMGRQERRQRAEAALERVHLTEFAQHRPATLSGGMRMRASLARTLTLEPDLFLFDEPFAAVDEITRTRLGDDLQALFTDDRGAKAGAGALFVTHSIAEAVYLAERVLVMSHRPGTIVAEVAVPLTYPRPPEIRFTPEFAELTAKVSAALRKGDAR